MSLPLTEFPEAFRPLRVVEYDALIDAGVLGTSDKVELVGGVLVEMSPQSDHHIAMIILLNRLLVQQCGDAFAVGAQTPIITDEISEPEPDFSVLPMREFFGARPREAVLIIEVSSSSRRFDLGEKASRYAAAGYPEYWVMDVVEREVHVHRGPAADGTWSSIEVRRAGSLTAVVPPVTLDLDAVLDF